MSETGSLGGLGPTALFLMFTLGAYHGVNPGMGWLFAVALGLQEKSGWAVGRSLIPIALGHGLAIGAVVFVAAVAQTIVPLSSIKIPVAVMLFGFGLYCLVRQRHPRWGGMQVGFGDLTFWSFLMASAHGAGLMVVPVLLGAGAAEAHAHGSHLINEGSAARALQSPLASLTATLVHTVGYLVVTGLVAWVVYSKLGLGLLRRAWVNLDLVWAATLIVTACLTLLI